MLEIPTRDLDDPKEIYVFAGLALYQANLLEVSLINLAAVLQLDGVEAITHQLFETTFETLEAKTLGQLLRATRSLTSVPAELDVVLEEALKRRNFLIHDFFRVYAADITHPAGIRLMIEELSSIIRVHQQADEEVTRIYELLCRKYGVDEDFVEREIAEMRSEMGEKYGEL